MHKPAAYLFAVLVGPVIWFFFQHFDVEGIQSVHVVPKEQSDGFRLPATGTMDVHLPASIPRQTTGSRLQLKPSSLEFQRSSGATIRVASFHVVCSAVRQISGHWV